MRHTPQGPGLGKLPQRLPSDMQAEHNPMESWYALYVRSHFERTVVEGLQGKGYSAFAPYYQTMRKRSERTLKLDLPLFPGYVFCRFNCQKRLPILTTPGIVKIVGAGNVPESINLSEIYSFQTVSESGRPVQPWPFLPQGHPIRVEAGPLSGTVGSLLRVKDEVRLVVSITLLQRSMAVELDQEWVSPIY